MQMDEKMRQEVANFRYGLIAPLVTRKLEPGEQAALLREITSHTYDIPGGQSTKLQTRTLAGVYELATNKSLQTLHHKDFRLRKCITLLTHIDLCSAHPASSFARVPSWSGRRIPGLSWMLPAWDRQ
jgi:hypothetical protein